jgi:hypothetical protein
MLDRHTKNNTTGLWLAFIPAMFIYLASPALQFNVGTDYFSYIRLYESGNYRIYFNNGEYGFYFMNELLTYFNIDSQGVFVAIGAIDTFLIFLILATLKKYKFKLWIIFFLIFVVSGIYHNQMNGLRQFVAILCTPLFFIYMYERKYLKLFLISVLALSFHKTFVTVLLFGAIAFIAKNYSKRVLLLLSALIPFMYLFVMIELIYYAVDLLVPSYKHFFTLDIIENNRGLVLVKLYYMPFFIYFWYLYLKTKQNDFVSSELFKFFIVIFSLTYSMYLLQFSVAYAGRIFQYFQFFYIFPLYYIIEYNIKYNNRIILLVGMFALLIPYIAKVLWFPAREYLYSSILFQ